MSIHADIIIADPNDVSWLGFLSNNPPPSNASNVAMQLPSLLPPSTGEVISWERDRPHVGNGTPTMGPSLTLPSSSNAGRVDSPKRKSSKRPRVDSGMDGDKPEKQEKEVTGDVEMKQSTSGPKAANTAGDEKVGGEEVGEDKTGQEE